MGYDVRDESGLLTLKIGDETAKDIIDNTKGIFRPYTPKDGNGTKTAFELTENKVLIVTDIRIYLWEKTLLIPE